MAADERFPRHARIRKAQDLKNLLRHGRQRRAGPLVVYSLENAFDRPRMGVIVPKHGRTSAERNRLARQIREILRREWLAPQWQSRQPIDLLVRAYPAAYDLSGDQLRALLAPRLKEVECGES